MKSKKSKKSKKEKKIKLNLFQKVHLQLKRDELAIVVLLCAGVFGSSFLIGKGMMGDGDKKIIRAFQSENIPPSENQKIEDIAAAEESISPAEEGISEKISDKVDPVTEYTTNKLAAKKTSAPRPAAPVRILSGPVPTGKTHGLPDGRRECATKSLHPQRGGKTHVDEDCCADYNEYPNPRCYYPPGKMEILKKR